MHTKLKMTLALGLAAGLIATGCGGDDDETTTTSSTTAAVGATGATGATGASGGEPLSEEEFVKQGNAICGESEDAIDGGADAVKTSQDALAELQQLTPPEADADTYEQFLAAIEADIAQLKSGDQDTSSDTDALAGELGLDGCVD